MDGPIVSRCSELLVDDPSDGDEDKLLRHLPALIKFSSLHYSLHSGCYRDQIRL